MLHLVGVTLLVCLLRVFEMPEAFVNNRAKSYIIETSYSKASGYNSEKGYRYNAKLIHGGPNPSSYSYEIHHTSSSPSGFGLYGLEYASNYDTYVELPIELDLDSNIDYDTDLDYDSYFDHDVDLDDDLDADLDFVKYKYKLYGLNHFTSSGPFYNDLKFSRRFKNWKRRPYLNGIKKHSRHGIRHHHHRPSSFFGYDLDLDLDHDLDFDDQWDWGLGGYGRDFSYDKYLIGLAGSLPYSYVHVHKF